MADRWDTVVRRLVDEGRVTGLVKELAWQGGLVARDDGPPAVWHLRIPHESLRGAALKDKLTEALCASLGVQPMCPGAAEMVDEIVALQCR